MDITYKAVSATITDTSSGVDEFPGTFEVELSNETTDRDGDTLKASDWETPLPDQITFVNDHTHKMASVVGSAKPTLVGDKILCKGIWGATATAQDTRKIAPHVPYVSVAYAEKSNGKRELINGAFVVVPSNPTARLLASKGFDELADDTPVTDLTIKQFREMSSKDVGPDTLSDALAEVGLFVSIDKSTSTVQVKQHGNLLGEHKFSQQAPEVAPVITTADQSNADSLGEKAAAQALAAANQMAIQLLSEQD
jgi:flagellar hook-associated protein FlgK